MINELVQLLRVQLATARDASVHPILNLRQHVVRFTVRHLPRVDTIQSDGAFMGAKREKEAVASRTVLNHLFLNRR